MRLASGSENKGVGGAQGSAVFNTTETLPFFNPEV
jgi:hypothetical protein